jgi:Domain of Unknown Function (DUF1080)
LTLSAARDNYSEVAHSLRLSVQLKFIMKSHCKIYIRTISPIVFLLLLSLCDVVSAQSAAKPLFNGRDLDGWEHVGPGSFIVKDGLLITEGGMGLLWYTRERIQKSVLNVMFKLNTKGSDSGVFIRIPERPTEPWMPVNRGYEVEIGDWPDDYSCTGVLYSFTKALARPIKPMGQWNTLEITVDGPHTVVYLNEVKVTDFREGDSVPARKESYDPERGPRQDSGYIGLQNEPGSEVYFKEISVRLLH